MTKVIELDFGTVKISHCLLVAELKEGILLDVASNRKLLEIGHREFKGKPYGYISHRIFSYAVDPLVYRESAEFSALKAIAVVSHSAIGRQSAELERKFYRHRGTFEIFESFEEALFWIRITLSAAQLVEN